MINFVYLICSSFSYKNFQKDWLYIENETIRF